MAPFFIFFNTGFFPPLDKHRYFDKILALRVGFTRIYPMEIALKDGRIDPHFQLIFFIIHRARENTTFQSLGFPSHPNPVFPQPSLLNNCNLDRNSGKNDEGVFLSSPLKTTIP